MKNKLILFTMSFAFFLSFAKAQKIQVVTKIIEKDLTYTVGEEVKVNAEKSNVEVHGWAKNAIHIKVKLISKHANRSIAERELEYLHFGITDGKKLLELTNTFVLPRDIKKVEGNLKTEYEIWLPTSVVLGITNKFGNIKLNGLRGIVNIASEYCAISMGDCKGNIIIDAVFSDVKGTGLLCNLKCKNDHADIDLNVIGGEYQIETSYGKIVFNALKKITSLNISATRCPAVVTVDAFDKYQYDLQTSEAAIDIPSTKYNIYRKDVAHQKRFIMKDSKQASNIKIKTTFEQISVR